VNIQGVLTKGNFDQMQAEVKNLSKISKVYVSTTDSQYYSSLFEGKAEHLISLPFSLPDFTLGKLIMSVIFFLVGFVQIADRLGEVEIIVSQGTTALQAAVANFVFHKPHVMFLHYFAYNEQFVLRRGLLANLFRIVELFVVRNCNLVIAPNEKLKADALEQGAKSVQIIPNFVETGRIDKVDTRGILRKRFHFTGRKVVLFVGRLHPVKNVDLLLRSFNHINTPDDCILVIIGDGPEKQRLTDLASSLGISKRIFFVGFKKKDEVLEYMKASDVLVLPSLVEGQPRVVLEAWAAKLPVVASRRPGLEDLITDRINGWLFSPGSDIRLAETIALGLDNNIANRIRSNAKRYVQQYDVDRVLSEQRSIVLSFLQNKENYQKLNFDDLKEPCITIDKS